MPAPMGKLEKKYAELHKKHSDTYLNKPSLGDLVDSAEAHCKVKGVCCNGKRACCKDSCKCKQNECLCEQKVEEQPKLTKRELFEKIKNKLIETVANIEFDLDLDLYVRTVYADALEKADDDEVPESKESTEAQITYAVPKLSAYEEVHIAPEILAPLYFISVGHTNFVHQHVETVLKPTCKVSVFSPCSEYKSICLRKIRRALKYKISIEVITKVFEKYLETCPSEEHYDAKVQELLSECSKLDDASKEVCIASITKLLE
jgi:hypothetical protein